MSRLVVASPLVDLHRAEHRDDRACCACSAPSAAAYVVASAPRTPPARRRRSPVDRAGVVGEPGVAAERPPSARVVSVRTRARSSHPARRRRCATLGRVGYYTRHPIMWALAISLTMLARDLDLLRLPPPGAGLRAARAWRWMLLPFAAFLTGTLTLAAQASLDAVTLLGDRPGVQPDDVARAGPARGRRSGCSRWPGRLARGSVGRSHRPGGDRAARPAADGPATRAPVDPEMAEIEAILRKRGIT